MFRRQANIARKVFLSAKRSIHEVPSLKNEDIFSKNGIEGLYSPKGFKLAWSDYQKYLTTNLTLQTNGTENELRSAYQVLLHTAKQTTEQHTFHFASQAHNNHLFFQQLDDKSRASNTRPSRFLMERLADQDITSMEALRDRLLTESDSFTGQGWLFLVELPDKSLKFLRCENDGTPYYYGKNQSLDLNGGIDESSYEKLNELNQKAANREKDFTLPILAINAWSPAYIEDYGVTGRSKYLENVWNCINWDVVNKRLFQL